MAARDRNAAMTDFVRNESELILYQTEDGRTRIECRFEGETLWLTQGQMAELFQTTPQNITLHLSTVPVPTGASDPRATLAGMHRLSHGDVDVYGKPGTTERSPSSSLLGSPSPAPRMPRH
ncbi:MAG: hypothetical protein ACREBE_12325 [bacterium]